jgi:hypothetical protein
MSSKGFRKKEVKVPNKKVGSANNTSREISKVANNVDQDDSNKNGDEAQNDENVDQISPKKVHESEPSENKPIFPPDPKEVISKATCDEC